MAQIEMLDLKTQLLLVGPKISEKINTVMEHGRFIMGPEVVALEAELSQFCGVSETVTCGNGTDALQIALMAEGVGPGDAVFVPSFTFTATAEVILVLGAVPVFCDVDPRTFNLSFASLKAAVSKVRAEGQLRPKVVIAVDLFGLPNDYQLLRDFCILEELFLIADAAQSFGGSEYSKRVGCLAPVTTTSFFPAKPLGCFGDGGALFTDDPIRADIYRSIRAHGKGSGKYDIVRIGMNSRLDTIQAVVLQEKLKIFEDEILARNRIAWIYSERLSKWVDIPVVPENYSSAWAQYTIRSEKRDKIIDVLASQSIPYAIYYPLPMHKQLAYRSYFSDRDEALPVSEALSNQVISLPMHPYLTVEAVNIVCDAIETVFQG